ncbi:MAG: hypothetical protein RPU59_13910 [Candidatus Sedimenticola sp. (ex Thyasira tokunagai)]
MTEENNGGCFYSSNRVAWCCMQVTDLGSIHGEEWVHFTVKYQTADKRTKKRDIPLAALYSEPKKTIIGLAREGFLVVPGKEMDFMAYLASEVNKLMEKECDESTQS